MNQKLELTETVRLFEALGLFDMNGHVSLRVKDGFLTHGRQAGRSTLTVNDIIKVGLDGVKLEGTQEPPNEVYLHSEIYSAREDVFAIAHFHGHWNNILSVAGVPFAPICTVACGLGAQIPVYPDLDSISSRDRGREVAQYLGENSTLILRAHGVIVTGNSLKEVLVASKFLEMNAERQVYVHMLNPAAKLSNDEIERIGKALWIPKNIEKTWLYYYEKAKREGKFQGIS